MRTKLIILAGFFVFFLGAWMYFQTPDPPIPELKRPKIDRALFKGTAGNVSPGSKDLAERRKERLERRKKLREERKGKNQDEEGFLSRLTDSKDPKAKRPELRSRKKAAIKAPSRMGKRRDAVEKNREKFLSKRRGSITPKPIRRSKKRTKPMETDDPELMLEDLEAGYPDEEIGPPPIDEGNPEAEGAYPGEPQADLPTG